MRCFHENPSVKSSLKFLRRTPWARKKGEELFVYTLQKHGTDEEPEGEDGKLNDASDEGDAVETEE